MQKTLAKPSLPSFLLVGALPLYLLLRSTLCAGLLYLLIQALPEPRADVGIALGLFLLSSLILLVLLLVPRLSLRLSWAVLGLLLLYATVQVVSDYWAAAADSRQAILGLYRILQARMGLLLASLLLLSGVLAVRFGRYRSLEALLLLLLSLVLLTRDELSLSFDSRYWLYRLFWLTLPLLALALLALGLHPRLRGESSWLPPDFRQRPNTLGHRRLIAYSRRFASFAVLLLLLFLAMWLSHISPINWNRSDGSARAGNGLLQKDLNNQFDFGEYLQLDSALEQNRQLVLMARAEDLNPDRPSYLVRFTLAGIDRRGQFVRDAKEPNMPGETPLPLELERGLSAFEMPQYDLRRRQQMDIFLLNIKPSSLFSPNYPLQVQTYENWPDSSFSRVYRVHARTTGDLFLPEQSWQQAQAGYSEAAGQLDYYTQFPQQYNDIRDFAIRVLQENGLADAVLDFEGNSKVNLQLNPLQLAQLFTDYFHREYRYTLKPGIAEDGDQLRYFLYQSKKGYCTYFAFSAALMLRSLGVPTRVAVGFLLNPQLRILDYYPLFADQAHAWLEVYDPQQGWLTFDPTTFELAPGEQLEFGLPEGAEADLAALTEELLRNNSLNTEGGLQQRRAEGPAPQKFLQRIWQSFRSQVWLGPALLFSLLLVLLLGFRYYLLWLSLRKPLPSAGASVRRMAAAMYYYLLLLHCPLFAAGGRGQSRSSSDADSLAGRDTSLELDWKAKVPPQQLCLWQQALHSMGHSLSQTQESLSARQGEFIRYSLVCLDLFQQYCFAPQFSIFELAQLRQRLQILSRRQWRGRRRGLGWGSWQPLALAWVLLRFLSGRNNFHRWRASDQAVRSLQK